jgi:hypothetical protein
VGLRSVGPQPNEASIRGRVCNLQPGDGDPERYKKEQWNCRLGIGERRGENDDDDGHDDWAPNRVECNIVCRQQGGRCALGDNDLFTGLWAPQPCACVRLSQTGNGGSGEICVQTDVIVENVSADGVGFGATGTSGPHTATRPCGWRLVCLEQVATINGRR